MGIVYIEASIVTFNWTKQRIQLLKPRSNVHFLGIFHIWQNTFSLNYSTSTNHHHHQQTKSKTRSKKYKKKIKKLRRRKSYNYLVLNLIEDEREKMATMKIPMTVPSPRVDAEQLFKAFKGIIFNGYKQGFFHHILNYNLVQIFRKRLRCFGNNQHLSSPQCNATSSHRTRIRNKVLRRPSQTSPIRASRSSQGRPYKKRYSSRQMI